ncbi:tRNA 4-thiouridine(8) synthase ThiI [Candidatus Gracilibacteria bacterium]|nr:tRNA 4-thiouridine(8) synthase ThiI [Candidatus Gracilibacteria bacterium]
MKRCIIVHYDEIGLKGKNRDFFENKLIQNINEKIRLSNLTGHIHNIFGRLKIVLNTNTALTKTEQSAWIELLSTTFGLAYFGFAFEISSNEEAFIEGTKKLIEEESFETFRVTASRTDKLFPKTSMEINQLLGGVVLKNTKDKKVKLKNPDLEIFVEILGKTSFLYGNKQTGPGGLPVSCGGKSIVLISGGIDSPVAAFFAQKRGLHTTFIHFHSYPQTSQKSVDKVRELVKKLTRFSPTATLYMCPFLDIQKEILKKSPDKFRILLYRRFMYRIAEKLAGKIGAKCLITGESLGQVASQTIENITVTQDAVAALPILRPLIGFDKKEIISYAKKIDTFTLSIRPHDDCCTVYMPKNPETKGNVKEILKQEEIFEVDTMISRMMEKLEIEKF